MDMANTEQVLKERLAHAAENLAVDYAAFLKLPNASNYDLLEAGKLLYQYAWNNLQEYKAEQRARNRRG